MDTELFSANNWKKNNRSEREEASSRYKHVHKTDFTDSSVGRGEDCSARSKFDSNPYVAGSNPSQWMQYCFLLTIFKKITDLIGKKLDLGTSMFIRQIPLIAQLAGWRTVV